MTLEELLWKINDSTFVKIFSINGNEIAAYDGKDSIPEELNPFDVTDIFVADNMLCIEVDDTELYIEEDDDE